MTALITATESTTNYFNDISVLNPEINPSVQGSDFWAKGNAIGNQISGISQNIYITEQQLFVQTCSGTGVDKQLASWGQIPRMGVLPSVGSATLSAVPSSNFTIPAGTTLTYAPSNATFVVQVDTPITIAGGGGQTFPILSQNTGSGIQIPNGSTLTFSTPIGGYTQATSTGMTDGSDVESDLQCITRLLTAIQQPRLGGTLGDYQTWALSVNGVTGAQAFDDLYIDNSVAVVALSGGSDYDSILNTPATTTQYYSRTANQAIVSAVSTYVQTKRPAGANVFCTTVITQFVAESTPIVVDVVLAQGLTLSTILPNADGLTVEELIQREVRRAIITSPLNGTTLTAGTSQDAYILLSDIEQVLDVGLSAGPQYQGIYASILLDRTVTYDGGNNNILLSSLPDVDGKYPFVYDILYENISVATS